MKTCPECGVEFTPHNGRQTFCTTAHQVAFHNRSKRRGMVAIPLLLEWRRGKRGGRDSSVYALRELTRIADAYLAQDKSAGRRSDLIVKEKMDQGWIARDTMAI